ncbi:MAG TPA: c-type cytochrome domain-containing protein [Pedobacter sp.]|nr:c-type cytochrome domain-containing protein [Pedobacter sp.]
MKFTLKGFAENLLFAANVFIIFLLIFGDKIAIPVWLQPIGRMHPMLLHFPIVLLMLAMVLEFFRFKETYAKESLYQSFTSGLLLSGALLGAVTVIMGLFLSKEQSYAGEILNWHKWTGVGIVFFASIIYRARNTSWYKAPAARAGAVLTTVCLIMAGHYGAILTHGDNFVLEPVSPAYEQQKVPVAQARVFEDVIMPIFSQKCLNCHNLDKAKGGLIMTDAKSMMKGGKNGTLFVPGQPAISLLLQRIHLPETDKKHMPPKSESQLTADEVAMLNLWVKNNAEMKKKVLDLAAGDSLRILATAYLAPTEIIPEEDFDFSAADEEDIKKLNNNYRVIYPLAKNSPALTVTVYNKSSFRSDVLKELEPIRKQIVSINLSGMPLKDDDLKLIAELRNLRKLNINFTTIKGPGLKHLKNLEYLRHVSLSSTAVTLKDVNEFVKSGNLRQITLWNTGLNAADLQKLQKNNQKLHIDGGFKDDGKSFVKLNQPRLNTDKSTFAKPFNLELKHAVNGVQIRYTLDGSNPDSLTSAVYKDPLPIHANVMLKARAFKKGWSGSDLLVFPLYRNAYKPDSIVHSLPSDPNLTGGGPPALIDGQFGSLDIYQGRWTGYIANHMETIMFFKKPVMVQSVGLNTIKHLALKTLLPQVVEVWGGKDKAHLKLLGIVKSLPAKKDDLPVLVTMEVAFKAQEVSCIKVVARNTKKLPAWHPEKNVPAVMFVDELFVN